MALCQSGASQSRLPGSCGPSLVPSRPITRVFCHVVSLMKDEWSSSFPPGEFGVWACVALVA